MFEPDALAAYRHAFRDPAVVHTTCEDYRAGATVDHQHDAQDQAAGRRISCPTLVLWGEADATSEHAQLLDTWRRWADDVSAGGLACGHFLSEEAPDALLRRLEPFLERALSPTVGRAGR